MVTYKGEVWHIHKHLSLATWFFQVPCFFTIMTCSTKQMTSWFGSFSFFKIPQVRMHWHLIRLLNKRPSAIPDYWAQRRDWGHLWCDHCLGAIGWSFGSKNAKQSPKHTCKRQCHQGLGRDLPTRAWPATNAIWNRRFDQDRARRPDRSWRDQGGPTWSCL